MAKSGSSTNKLGFDRGPALVLQFVIMAVLLYFTIFQDLGCFANCSGTFNDVFAIVSAAILLVVFNVSKYASGRFVEARVNKNIRGITGVVFIFIINFILVFLALYQENLSNSSATPVAYLFIAVVLLLVEYIGYAASNWIMSLFEK